MRRSFRSSPAAATPSFLRAVSAIRDAASPQEALSLYKITVSRARCDSFGSYPFDTHAAVFTLKHCARLSIPGLVHHLHAHFLKSCLISNVYVATALLHAYVSSSFLDARRLFEDIPERNVVTTNIVMTGFCTRGDLTNARALFDGMPERDVATWSAMIGGYMGNGRWLQGFELFRRLMLVDRSVKPDQVTVVSILSCCSMTGSLPLLGKSIHAYCARNDVQISVPLGTALVNMYAKSGFVRYAFIVFKMMPERNVATWSALICGLAMHGHGVDALRVFDEMRKAGVTPNGITFTGVLNACCHCALVEEAKQAFLSMTEEYGLKPSVHHYGCMVDLLGRAGLLEEAHEVVVSMTVEPNIVVWTSLLAACKMHRNFEVASRVMDLILDIPITDDSGGLYTLLADVYAMAGKWDDVERVRKLMDVMNVKKRRGSSFVEM